MRVRIRATGVRTGVWVAVSVLVLSACGARLTEEQRAAGIGAFAAGGAGGPGGVNPTAGPGVVNPTAGPSGVNPTAGPAGPTPDTLPPGGNGGATDVGVTATTLKIATIADVQGVQPGLFKSAWQAMQAAVAMANSQGGLDGRQLELLLLDSKIDSGGTREAVLKACKDAFAIVGSMSAFDAGGAEAVEDCGIPDMSAITVSLARVSAAPTYPVYPNRPDWFVIGSGRYIKQRHPNAAGDAAQLWLNASTTKINAESKRDAYASLGYQFDYRAETQVVESNYTPYVQKMKDRNIKYVTMTSDWQSIARLLDAMRKQRWKPEVLEWDSVVYTPKFLEEVQGAADGSYVYLNTALLEEINQNPEMQLYAQWLARVAPGVQPDYFGLYAWSAGRLFLEVAKKAGPAITRAKLIAELKKVHAWDGNGLHAAHDVGNKLPSHCTSFVRIENNQFVRHAPAKGFMCDQGKLYRVS